MLTRAESLHREVGGRVVVIGAIAAFALMGCGESGSADNDLPTPSLATDTCPPGAEWRMNLALPEAVVADEMMKATQAAVEVACTALEDVRRKPQPSPGIYKVDDLPQVNSAPVYGYGVPEAKALPGQPVIRIELTKFTDQASGRLFVSFRSSGANGMANVVAVSLMLTSDNPALQSGADTAPTAEDFATASNPQFVTLDSITFHSARTGYGGYISRSSQEELVIRATLKGDPTRPQSLDREIKNIAQSLAEIRHNS